MKYQQLKMTVGMIPLCLFFLAAQACSGEATPEPEVLDIEAYTATITSVKDKFKTGTTSDFVVAFKGGERASDISSYRLFVMKSSSAPTADGLGLALANQYTEVDATRSSYSVRLDKDQLDVDGDPIVQAIDYQFAVLSVGTFQGEEVMALSEVSDPVANVINKEVTTLSAARTGNDGMSVDAEGNLYISNYGSYNPTSYSGTGSEVIKITPSGSASVFLNGLTGPLGNAIAPSGNFYVNSGSNFSSGELIKYDADQNKTTLATLPGYPAGMVIDEDENIYVTNYYHPALHKVSADGEVTTISEDVRLQGCVGIAWDDAGNLILGNYISGKVLQVTTSGSISVIATLPTKLKDTVIGYLTYFDGYIYATGNGANLIYRISLSGTVEEFAGTGSLSSDDGELAQASFNRPNGITVDKVNRKLYISQGGGEIRMIDLD